MIIRPEITQSVVFVGYQKADGTFIYCGTAFYYTKVEGCPCYAITARHVIDGIRSLGLDSVYIRVNLKNGKSAHYSSKIEEWYFHPTDKSIDVAIIKTGVPDNFDHLVLLESLCITDEIINEQEVGQGDAVSITGLFRHHHGVDRNIPIVRTGNLASMLVQQIVTKNYGEIEGYLIEARSIGGLSGSPVFLNLGSIRMIKGRIKYNIDGIPVHHLLGLIHGHFDVKSTELDDATQDGGLSADKVNTGIAIVVPIHKIKEVILLYEESSAAAA